MNQIKVVALVVDIKAIHIYKDNGDCITLPQGDIRVRKIVDEAVPQIRANGFAMIDLPANQNGADFTEFEKNTSGAIRFFRVTRMKISQFLGIKPKHIKGVDLTPLTVGSIPDGVDPVEEVMRNAIPSSDEKFSAPGLPEQGDIATSGNTSSTPAAMNSAETIIAVTADNKMVPNMELLRRHIGKANMGNTVGMQRLIERLCAMSDRQHSVEDLIRFLERSDLPIADNGDIVIYKLLQRSESGEMTYVDCHTQKVTQRVGSYVYMDPSMVDMNRRNECSNGLHVARRGYLKNFSGNVCVIAKLAPESIIAVPHGDANKVRVCGYHIVAEVNQEAFNLLQSNKAMTADHDSSVLLANIIAGKHIDITNKVKITKQNGGGLEITEVQKLEVPAVDTTLAPVNALPDSGKTLLGNPMAEKEISKIAKSGIGAKKQARAEAIIADDSGSHRDRIHAYIALGITKDDNATRIMEIKRKSKKGWEALGVTVRQSASIIKHSK